MVMFEFMYSIIGSLSSLTLQPGDDRSVEASDSPLGLYYAEYPKGSHLRQVQRYSHPSFEDQPSI